MNRKQRRVAAKQGRHAVPSGPIAEPLATALRHHEAGQLVEAEVHYRRALVIVQNDVGNRQLLARITNNLGNALKGQCKLDEAVAQYQRALTLEPELAEAHNNLGTAFKLQGKLDKAMAHFERALVLKSDYAQARYNLGNALKQQSKWDGAIAEYQRALALKPNYVEAHNNLANALMAQGRLDEAIAQFQRLLAFRPNFAEAHINLGNALELQGKFDEAVARYQQALVLEPNFPEAHNGLGNALKGQGKLDEAVAEYQRALALNPDFAAAHNNLGTALQDQGKVDEAVAYYRRALTLDSRDGETYGNLSLALMEKEHFAQALEAIQRGIEIGDSENCKTLFVQCVRSLNAVPRGIDLRKLLIRALSEPWGRTIDIAKFCADLLKLNGAVGACIERASRAWPKRLTAQELFSPVEFAEICDDQLLRCLLRSTLVCDTKLERFLTAIRLTMLEAANAAAFSHQLEENALRFYSALSQQCFTNEYVFAHTDHEIAQAQCLRARLVEALKSGTSVPELWLLAVSAYFPPASLPDAELIVGRPWSVPTAALMARQVQEWQEEQQLRTSVPRLTTIGDAVSLEVKQQYEDNPYPRWVKAAPVRKFTTVEACLRHKFPLACLPAVVRKGSLEILIAGCGTGQHSIETARRFPDAQVLAVDLSLTSLCYAKRKTREIGLNNIEYAQADILQLESIGRTFDVIEASGVLHHLADPLASWHRLLSLLRPGGFMRVGLYSKMARQDINEARAFIAQRHYRPSAEDIRRCRDELASYGDDTPLKRATEMLDFFSTSACRDLLFHIKEHQLTLPEISAFLSQNHLEFLGFDIDRHVLRTFRWRFPRDKAMTDLDLWHVFETENPAIFLGMYQFWIRHAASA
jgi:tetratricopeptide (TPR) repeat protein/2-polyprenyl-3-methyl-5-hydroxy-6-metoxy-1,4-benzoquinol methylase